MMKLEGKLTRKNAHYLETGLLCGLGSAGRMPCGGQLLVRDWSPVGVNGAARYELYCDRCLAFDPEGMARLDEILPTARRTFRGWVKDEVMVSDLQQIVGRFN